MKKLSTWLFLSIFFVAIFIGAWFYYFKKNNQSEFVDIAATPVSYGYPKINNLDDLKNAFSYLSTEKIPYNIEGLEEYSISYQDFKLLFPEISKNIKPERIIELSVNATKYIPGTRIYFEGSDVGSYDGCKNWLESLKVGPYKEEVRPGNSCLNTMVSDNSTVRRINNNIYYVNDTTSLHLLNYWIRNYQTYNSVNNTIIDVIIVYGKQEIEPKEQKDIQNVFLEIEKLLP
jgi:hypothetical protein